MSLLYYSFWGLFPTAIRAYCKTEYVYERGTTSLVRRMLQKDLVFVDAGAHVGHYTLLASKLCSQVYAFEPAPENFAALEQLVKTNELRNVQYYPYAVWKERVILPFYLHNDSSAHSLIGTTGKFMNVQAVSLGEILRDEDNIAVKADVEGAELYVIEGMRRILSEGRVRFMIVEFYDKIIPVALAHKCFEIYRAIGEVFVIERNGIRKATNINSIPSYCNLLVVPTRQRARELPK